MTAIPLETKPARFNPGLLAWLALIGLLLIVGVVSAIQVFWHGLIITNMSNTVPWGLWITIDLSSIALGAGAFTLSAVVYLLGLKTFKPIIEDRELETAIKENWIERGLPIRYQTGDESKISVPILEAAKIPLDVNVLQLARNKKRA